MKKWNDLNLVYKLIFGLLLLTGALIFPELMFVVDVGGIEMAFAFLVLYCKSIIAWCEQKLDAIKSVWSIFLGALQNSSVSQPKTFSIQVLYCAVVLFGTGSLLFSMSFFFQGMLINVV